MNQVFEQNPKLEKYYGTSDGEAFYNENDAKNHAKNLEDKTVETVFNTQFLEVNDTEELTEEELAMQEFEDANKVVDLSKLTKAKLLEFAKEKGFVIVDEKATNEKLIEEITVQLNANTEQ